MKKPSLAVTLAISLAPWTSIASTPPVPPLRVDFDRGNGTVEFTAIGRPSALRIRGKGQAPQGFLTLDGKQISGQVAFRVETLETGIATRDRHMKEKYLETAKFPVATLQLSRVAMPERLPEGDFKLEGVAFEGPLTLHGKTVPVKGTVSLARASGQILMDAEFGLKVSDYAIDIPSFAGITMADEVSIHVHSQSPVVVVGSR